MGSYFGYHLCKRWEGSWVGVIEEINMKLFKVQIATGEGNLIQKTNRMFQPEVDDVTASDLVVPKFKLQLEKGI